MGSMDLTNPQSLNRYAYVNSNPLNAIDPDGLDPFNEGDMWHTNFCGGDPILCALFAGSAHEFCVFIGLCSSGSSPSSSGGGGAAGSSTASTTQTTPNVNPSGAPPLSGETLGIPNSIPFRIPSILQTLGLVPIDPACEFGPCSFMDGNTLARKYHCTFFGGVCYHNYYDPYPLRLFGRHWCGPGGAGPTLGPIDEACMAHDACYGRNNFTWSSNFDRTLSPDQVNKLAACNQQLCNAVAAHDNQAGATRIRMYFTLAPINGAQCQ